VTDGGTLLADQLSYDVFSQAGQAVMQPGGPGVLGGLEPRRLLASGASQSGHFLGTYYNAIQPLANRFDGFMIVIANPVVRTDLGAPVFKLHVETEAAAIAAGVLPPLQPDSDVHWTWQVAGTSHIDRTVYENGFAISNRDSIPIVVPLGVCARPELSRVPFYQPQTVAYDHLVRWITTGAPPPAASLIETAGGAVVRDAIGLAQGGIRLAAVAVPTAVNTGENSGPGFCLFLGSHRPFTPEEIRARYRSHGAYVAAVQSVVRANRAAGFVTQRDAQETLTAAARSPIGR
jgi:hypothetical protein